MGIFNLAVAFIHRFEKDILKKVGLPDGSYQINRQYLSFDESAEEVHHFVEFLRRGDGEKVTLMVPRGDSHGGGPFFWNGDTNDVVERIMANSNLDEETVRDRLLQMEEDASSGEHNRWERYLLKLAEGFEDDDALPEERCALRVLVRSRVKDERMFRAALVAVLNEDEEDLEEHVQEAKGIKKGDRPENLPRNPDGFVNNCSLRFGEAEKDCQMCKGSCPDRAKLKGGK